MTKALLPNVLVFSAFWILTLWSIRRDANLVSARGRREWILDLGGLVFQGVLIPLIQIFVLFKVLAFAVPRAQGAWDLAPALAFLLNFVLVDYFYYLNHRLLHLKPFWPAHAVHHSIERLDPVATSRNSLWTPVLIAYLWLNGLGVYFLKEPFWFLMGAAATAALDLWRHSFVFARAPEGRVMTFLSRFLILPIDHSWHHSQTHADFNFGANLNLWDRLHGTFARRRDRPGQLGIPTRLELHREIVDPYGWGPKILPALRAALPVLRAAGRAVKRVPEFFKRPGQTTGGISRLGAILAFFPLSVIVATAACLFLAAANPWWLAGAIFSLYLLPPLAFRIHNRFFPLEPGMSKLSGGAYSPWWGGHQMQVLYLAVPSLEAVLRIIPGVYSAWLRLWGSQVGKGVYWTPQVEITDRSLLKIGDHVVFAHRAAFYNHVANPRKDKVLLYVQPTEIQSGVFIGAGSRIGPGAVIEAGVQLPILTDVHVNQRITAEMEFNPREKTNSVNGGRSLSTEPAPAANEPTAAELNSAAAEEAFDLESAASAEADSMSAIEIERDFATGLAERADEFADQSQNALPAPEVKEEIRDYSAIPAAKSAMSADLAEIQEIQRTKGGSIEEANRTSDFLDDSGDIAWPEFVNDGMMDQSGNLVTEETMVVGEGREPSVNDGTTQASRAPSPILMGHAVEFTPLSDTLDVESLDAAIAKSQVREPQPAAEPTTPRPVAEPTTPKPVAKPTYRVEHSAAWPDRKTLFKLKDT